MPARPDFAAFYMNEYLILIRINAKKFDLETRS